MSDVLRAQLLATRATAQALITTIDVALQASAEPERPASPGECAHDNVEEIARMGGAPRVRLCLDCNREVES